MAINLQKGQTIDLRKNDKGESLYDLSQVTVGLGWDVREEKSGFLSKLFGGAKEEDFDLDAIAFLLDDTGHISNLGQQVKLPNGAQLALHKSDVIFYHNITFPSGTGPSSIVYGNLSKSQIATKVSQLLSSGETIVHTGDNLTGEGDGDDEQIIVKLDSLPSRISKIVFLVSIYQGHQRNQHFGKVDNAFIRACDSKGKEIARYSLSNSPELNGVCSMVFGEMYRHDGTWKFRAIGNPESTDNFIEIMKRYIKQ
jgi:tellurium resistance protein TerD